MYMKNVMYKIIMGCYIVAALVLVTACNDSLDIQQAYPFKMCIRDRCAATATSWHGVTIGTNSNAYATMWEASLP